MKATTVKQGLQAVEYMLTHVGWCQGWHYRDKTDRYLPIHMAKANPAEIGSMCLVGAVALVDVVKPKLTDQIIDALNAQTKINTILSVFNDDSSTTKEKVLAVVRKAIKAAT